MPQRVSKKPMNLIPTVCGAVKFLQVQNCADERNTATLTDADDLQREGLELAKDAMRIALSRRVLEMTSTGNFRLKVLSDSFTGNELPGRRHSDVNRRRPQNKSKLKHNVTQKKSKSDKSIRPQEKTKFQKIAKLIHQTTSKDLHKIVQEKLQKHIEKKRRKNKPRVKKNATGSENGSNHANENNESVEKKVETNTKKRRGRHPKKLKSRERLLGLSADHEPTPPLKERLRKKDHSSFSPDINLEKEPPEMNTVQ